MIKTLSNLGVPEGAEAVIFWSFPGNLRVVGSSILKVSLFPEAAEELYTPWQNVACGNRKFIQVSDLELRYHPDQGETLPPSNCERRPDPSRLFATVEAPSGTWLVYHGIDGKVSIKCEQSNVARHEGKSGATWVFRVL